MLIELTNKCNKKCKRCFRYKRTGDEGMMADELYVSLINQLSSSAVLNNFAYLCGGGESFLHPHIYEYAQYAREHGCYVAIATNGTLIKEEDYSKLRYFNSIDFSYDSIAKLGELRDLKNEDRVLNAIQYARTHGINTRLQMLLSEDNWNEIDRMCNFCTTLGVTPSWVFCNPHYAKKDDDWDRLRFCLEHKDKFVAILDNYKFSDTQIEVGGSRRHCRFMNNDMSVLWNGEVVPCAYRLDEQYSIGDANIQTLEEIFFGVEYGEVRDGTNLMCALCVEQDEQKEQKV